VNKEKAVCDASVLINYAKIRRLDLLFAAFEKPLVIPHEVYDETVVKGVEKKEPDATLTRKAVEEKLVIVKATRADYPHPYLDSGEKAVISLALQERIKTVCFDEAPARNAAKLAGLKPVGSLGVLSRAVKAKTITAPQACKLLDEMVKRDFRLSSKITQEFKRAITS
jgi:predicted nucleic acid-binding protein